MRTAAAPRRSARADPAGRLRGTERRGTAYLASGCAESSERTTSQTPCPPRSRGGYARGSPLAPVARLAVPATTSEREIERFARELDRRLEPLDRGILTAEWSRQVGDGGPGPRPYQLQRTELLTTPGLLEWIRRAQGRSSGATTARRLALLERIALDARVEQHPEVVALRERLIDRIVAFRPVWGGRRVNREVLRKVEYEDPDPRRRRTAYEALEPLYRPMESQFLELVRLRNEKARALGFRSFAGLRLGFQGIRPEQLERFAGIAVRAARRRAQALRDRLTASEADGGWHPWDFAYALHKASGLPDRRFPRRPMLARVLRAVERWGFPTSRMRFRVVFHDLPAGGLTLAPDPPKDVRILVHPRDGWGAYHVMFHEVGHAVQSASIRAPGHLLRWHENVPGFGAFHEGIGTLFESIPRDATWLREEAGIPTAPAEEFAATRADADLFNAAWVAAWIGTELALYRNPTRAASAVGVRLDRDAFGYDRFPARSIVDSFYVSDPVYSANYLLARLFRYQLADTITAELGDPLWPNRRVGPWLTRHWFAPGSRIEWVPHLREVTGRPFGPEAFVRRFRAAA